MISHYRGSQDPPWGLVEVRGKDARDYLHRLSTSHVQGLAPNSGAPCCFLDGKGRILALGFLFCHNNETFYFETLPAHIPKLLELLDQFHFGEAVEFEARPELPVVALGEGGGEFQLSSTDCIRLSHDNNYYGQPWSTQWACGEPAHAEPYEALEERRITQLSPGPRELDETTLPVEVNFSGGVHRSKGCYPGQEVIEKIFTYGSPPKRLCLVQGQFQVGDLLYNEAEQEVGKVTSIGDGHALARLKKIHAKEGLALKTQSQEGSILKVAPYE